MKPFLVLPRHCYEFAGIGGATSTVQTKQVNKDIHDDDYDDDNY